MSEQATGVRLHFAQAGRWAGSDEFPYDVPFWVLPRIGEVLNNVPDVPGWWIVADVEHDCSRGLHYPPTIRLLLRQR
jgi:hypothetical protein